MDIDTTVAELEQYLADLTTTEEHLKTELKSLQEVIQSLHVVLGRYPKWKASLPQNATPQEHNVTVQAIKDCGSQMAALNMIAERNQGYLKARLAARLLMESGLTISKGIDSATATIYRRVKEHPDWESYEPGIFRYIPFFARQQTQSELIEPPTNVPQLLSGLYDTKQSGLDT